MFSLPDAQTTRLAIAPPWLVSLIIVGTTTPLLDSTAPPAAFVTWPTTSDPITPLGAGL